MTAPDKANSETESRIAVCFRWLGFAPVGLAVGLVGLLLLKSHALVVFAWLVGSAPAPDGLDRASSWPAGKLGEGALHLAVAVLVAVWVGSKVAPFHRNRWLYCSSLTVVCVAALFASVEWSVALPLSLGALVGGICGGMIVRSMDRSRGSAR